RRRPGRLLPTPPRRLIRPLRARLALRERLQAGVPGPRRGGVEATLVHLPLQSLEQLAGVGERRFQLLLAALAQAPEEPELAVVDAEVDLAAHRRHPGEEAGAEQLPQLHRVVLLRHRRPEALVEVDRLEFDLARE